MSGAPFWKRTALVIAAAAIANVLVFAIARIAGVELLVPQGDTTMSLGIGPILIFTVVPLLLAAVLLLVLRRVGVKSPRVFAIVVIVGTLASLLAPLAPDLAAANKVVLSLMHLIVGGAALVGLTPLYRRTQSDSVTVEVVNV